MTGYKVIATKSTVAVGTVERLRDVIRSHQAERCRFDIVSNPEFLREGSAIEDFLRPNRIVIGADSPEAMAIMKDFFFSSRRRHTRFDCDWSSDVCSSD